MWALSCSHFSVSISENSTSDIVILQFVVIKQIEHSLIMVMFNNFYMYQSIHNMHKSRQFLANYWNSNTVCFCRQRILSEPKFQSFWTFVSQTQTLPKLAFFIHLLWCSSIYNNVIALLKFLKPLGTSWGF